MTPKAAKRKTGFCRVYTILLTLVCTLALSVISHDPVRAENRNSRSRLVAPLTYQDFLLAGVMDSPTHTLMHSLLRLGYVYALMLQAIDLKLQSGDIGSNPSRADLLKARKVFSRLMQPFLVGYPVANTILGTTEAGLLLLQDQMDYSMLHSP